MNLFNYVKKNTILILLFSILGVLTLFLPWIYYPRLELSIKGYDGDGYLISFMFVIILFINVYSLSRSGGKNKKRYNIITSLIAFLILTLSIYKIFAFYEDIFSFESNDPLTSYAGAGVSLQHGLFVISIISFVCLVLSSLGGYLTKTKHLVVISFIAILFGGVSYTLYEKMNSVNQLDKIEIEEKLNSQFEQMSNALVSKKTEKFVDYIHPIIYQSIGGKKKLAELMTELYKDVIVKDTKFEKTLKTKTKGQSIQVLFLQTITFVKGMDEVTNTNKSYAFSYDGGETWSFAGIEEKTFEDMKKILPELFEEMRF